MKKMIFAASLLTFSALFLTSCRVNWGSNHYNVSWWGIAIPMIAICAVVWIVAGKNFSKKKFLCPECRKTFSPKWWNAALSLHGNDKRVYRCPHCGRKGFCREYEEGK